MTQLGPKQSAFVREYLIDLNATQAAIRAGYSAKTATTQGPRLLENVGVAKAISEALQQRADRLEIKSDDVLRELFRIATTDIGDVFDEEGRLKPLKDIPKDTRRAIASIEVDELFDGSGEDRVQTGWVKKVKFWDKPKALELLGKHLKMFTDKIEHAGEDGGPLVFSIVRKVAR